MQLHTGGYFHIYNRSNGSELVFREDENYLHFLRRYRHHAKSCLSTLAYCLMPTHFHFLVRVTSVDIAATQQAIGRWLSSYTKAINVRYRRHGSLFQTNTRAKEVSDERYLLTVMTYIHQNPVRARLVERIEDWSFSSYPDLAGFRDGTLCDQTLISGYFSGAPEFREYSEKMVNRNSLRYE